MKSKKSKRWMAVILAAAMASGNSIIAQAQLQVVQGEELSSKIGDKTSNYNLLDDPRLEFVFDEYDPVSGLIPVDQRSTGSGFSTEDQEKLLFLNTEGQVVIPKNDWRLMSGFHNGQALVKEKSTGDLVVINTVGAEIGRFATEEEIYQRNVFPAPAGSQ